MSLPFTAELIVEPYLSGVRIDSFLVRHFRNYTAWRMQRIVRAGQVKVDDVTVRLSYRVYRRQRVQVRLIEPPDKLLHSEAIPLEILYEDPWLVVINKPAGLVTHPAADFHSGTLANALQHHLDRQSPLPGLLRPGLVHRLDRMTSGLIVATKHHLAHRLVSLQFQNGRISKTYLAIVEGALRQNGGTIDLPIGRKPGGRSILMSAKPGALEARPARTRYEVLQRFDGHTLVRANPLTGRIHQIRVHLAEIGHPIVGDEFYGPNGSFKPPRPGRAPSVLSDAVAPVGTGPSQSLRPRHPSMNGMDGRHALHAHRLGFAHPITRDWIEFEAPLPADMSELLARLREHGSVKEPGRAGPDPGRYAPAL